MGKMGSREWEEELQRETLDWKQCDVQNSWSTGICGEEKIFMEKPYQRGPQAKEYGLYSNVIRCHQMILSRGVI